MPYESGETGSIVSGPGGVRHELKVVTGMQCLQFAKVFASGESDIIGNQCTVANDEYRLQRRFAIGDCQHRMRSQRNRNKRTQWATQFHVRVVIANDPKRILCYMITHTSTGIILNPEN